MASIESAHRTNDFIRCFLFYFYISYPTGVWPRAALVLCFCTNNFSLSLYRVIENEREPVWDETNAVLVGPPEINAEEDLRLQLWDSGESFVRITTSRPAPPFARPRPTSHPSLSPSIHLLVRKNPLDALPSQ